MSKSLNIALPVTLGKRFEQVCDTNGYSRAFAVRTALHMFHEATHKQRIIQHQAMLNYGKKDK